MKSMTSDVIETRVGTGGLHGLRPYPVIVKCMAHNGGGLAEIKIDPDAFARPEIAKEIKLRVMSACAQIGIEPLEYDISFETDHKLTTGAPFDLPILLAILAVKHPELNRSTAVGQLSLNGAVLPVLGIVPLLRGNFGRVIVPQGNAHECSFLKPGERANIDFVENVAQALAVLRGEHVERVTRENYRALEPMLSESDVVEMPVGMLAAMEYALCGRQNLLLEGPPGWGSLVFAKVFHDLMPRPLSDDEVAEAADIQSVASICRDPRVPIFRYPHHTVSQSGLIGSESYPGEFSLATHGLLFLNELEEFRAGLLDDIRARVENPRYDLRWPSRPTILGVQKQRSTNEQRNEIIGRIFRGQYTWGKGAPRTTVTSEHRAHSRKVIETVLSRLRDKEVTRRALEIEIDRAHR